MYDCRVVEVCIFYIVGKVFVLFFGDGLECLVFVFGFGSYVLFFVEGVIVRFGVIFFCFGVV